MWSVGADNSPVDEDFSLDLGTRKRDTDHYRSHCRRNSRLVNRPLVLRCQPSSWQIPHVGADAATGIPITGEERKNTVDRAHKARRERVAREMSAPSEGGGRTGRDFRNYRYPGNDKSWQLCGFFPDLHAIYSSSAPSFSAVHMYKYNRRPPCGPFFRRVSSNV